VTVPEPSDKEAGSVKLLAARFVRDVSGQDLIEYGLLVGVVTATSVLTIRSLGEILLNLYSALQTNL
jgi:Flp pilus assembly pilin Flp